MMPSPWVCTPEPGHVGAAGFGVGVNVTEELGPEVEVFAEEFSVDGSGHEGVVAGGVAQLGRVVSTGGGIGVTVAEELGPIEEPVAEQRTGDVGRVERVVARRSV